MKKLGAFSLYLALVSALVFDSPAATPVEEGFRLEPQGCNPKPTEPPSVDELRKRQSIQNLLLAPDATCGFISGSSVSPFGLCCSSCTCGFATSPGRYGAFYCCNTAICESRIPTTCIDNDRFSVSSACDSKCVSDQLTLKCTSPPFVYCNLAEFETVNVQVLFCDTITVSSTQSVLITYAGEVARVLSTFTGFPSPTTTSTSSSTSSPSSSTNSSSSTSLPSPSPTTSSTQSQITSASPTTSTSPASPTDSSSSSPSSTPIGAIVGGSVGGAAVIAIIGVLIFLFRRKGTVQQSPQQAQGGGNYPSPQHQGVEQYQQMQHPMQDSRFSQQSQPYSTQYQQQQYNNPPPHQVAAPYNAAAPYSPGQVASHPPAAQYPSAAWAAPASGRYEVYG